MRRAVLISGLLAPALLGVLPATADTTYTYSINVQSSAGSLTGFIVTNTLGPLCAAPCVQFPIVDWNLVVTVGGVSAVLAGRLSGNTSVVRLFNNSGNALTATATGLYFNFAETDSQYSNYLQFASGEDNPVVVCFNNASLHGGCLDALRSNGLRSAIDWTLNAGGLSLDWVGVGFQGDAQIGSLVPPSVTIQIKPPAQTQFRSISNREASLLLQFSARPISMPSLELAQIVAQLVQAIAFLREPEGGEHGLMDLLGRPAADVGAAVFPSNLTGAPASEIVAGST
jgi:hypothetical protein